MAPTTVRTAAGRGELARRLGEAGERLRPADVVMQPARLGAARLTRYSFSRSLLRRVLGEGWDVSRVRIEMDREGRGHAVYRVGVAGHEFHFVAFTTTIDETQHTDRVVAGGWEVTAALVEGPLTDDDMIRLAGTVPLQERARLDARVLVLTRGNRSVRFYEYLVDELAAGRQPDAGLVGDAGYIMRSTAFYGNGKYGMRSFLGYPDGHPLGAPYRAQMLAAWLFRELSYDSVETCARQRGGAAAVGFDDGWRRFFGLGNATGLGLVPYFVKHPAVINSWCAIRELALADVRSRAGSDAQFDRLRWWLDRAVRHFATGGADARTPWLSPADLAAICRRVVIEVDRLTSATRPFDELYRWAESDGVETCELVVSLLIELDDSIDDDLLDDLLFVDEDGPSDPSVSVGELRVAADGRFGWLDGIDLGDERADHFWWAVSDDTDEPRRAPRRGLDPAHREVVLDVAHQAQALREALAATPADTTADRFLVDHPHLADAVARLCLAAPYGEARDNVCGAEFLPLQMQRFQLAMYGMDNFSPKSTDWLRVTLFQGAPRLADVGGGTDDAWVWPARPADPAGATT
ncbi:MAG: hypothetical protein HKN44_10535 [Ilumatobacter sp.]|nr:hypothetical protein [Ilumatobacter sp.]